MTQPLALVFYESLLAGNQLLHRLEGLDYRALSVSDLAQLHTEALRTRPLVVLIEVGALAERACAALRSLHHDATTAHIPVVAFHAARDAETDARLTQLARAAGAKVVIQESALLAHLEQVLDQALHVD